MPTKHIDDASFALAEENLVKAVMLTHTAVKESEMIGLLIRKGAQTITSLDILTHLPVANVAWDTIFTKVMDECAAQYPKEFICTPWEFCQRADKYSSTWKEYRNDDVHDKICAAGKRLQIISEITFHHLTSEYYLEPEEENKHKEWVIQKHKEMHEGLSSIDGNLLGTLPEPQKVMLEMMLESDDFQVSFTPVPDRRRADGQLEFTIHAAPFPDSTQAALLGLLKDLKQAGLKLNWHSSKLNSWLQDRRGDVLDELVFSLFTQLNMSAFTFDGGAEPARSEVDNILKKYGVGIVFGAAVIKLLNDLSGASKE